MILGLEHVAIASPEPAKLAEWYVNTLGFTVNYQSPRTTFVKAPNGSMIEIITAAGDRVPQTDKHPGLRHLALQVDDFDATYADLKSKNVSFVDEPGGKGGVKTVFLKDPEGNLLHLIHRETPLP